MKRITYIILLSFAVLFFSCEVDSGDSSYPRTLQGRVAYNVVERVLFQSVSILDMVCKVDHYACAPDEEQEGIHNYFLAEYAISNTEDSWILKNEYREIILTHNQKSINEKGAVWTIRFLGNSWDDEMLVMVENKNFRIESLGDKHWNVIASDLKYYNDLFDYPYAYPTEDTSSSQLTVKATKSYEKSPNLYDYLLEEGAGNMNVSSVDINYRIISPLSYANVSSYYSNFSLIGGKLNITVDNDQIEAEIKPSTVNITFNGITETYN